MATTPPPALYYPPPIRRKRRGCMRSCCRCLCCCCCFIFLIFIIQICSFLYIYLTYHPQIPQFTIEKIDYKTFEIKADATLLTDLHVLVKVENPNKEMAFIYGGDDSSVTVHYGGVVIASGKLPVLRQGHQNTTAVEVDLKGDAKITPEIQRAFTAEQKNHPMVGQVKMKVPVNVLLGDIQTKKLNIKIDAVMAFFPFSPNKTVQILSTKYGIEF